MWLEPVALAQVLCLYVCVEASLLVRARRGLCQHQLSSPSSTCLIIIIIIMSTIIIIIIVIIIIISSSNYGSYSSYSGWWSTFGRRMPMPSLEFMSRSVSTSIVVFRGSGSIIPSCLMIAGEDLPSFLPAFSTFLLRTVWASTQSRAPGCCSAGPQGAQDGQHDDARATG